MTDTAAFDAVTEALREQLCDLLRRVRPRVIFCYVQGEKRKMDTGGGRGVRYSQLARVIVAMGSTLERVDLCNAKGELIESWHPRGAIVEDEPPDAADVPALAMPAGLASLPAELVGQVLTLCLSFSAQVQANIQRAVDHAVDRKTAGDRVLVHALTDLLKSQTARTDNMQREVERREDRLRRREREADLSQIEARETALDARRLATENDDPNSPDAIAGDFARRFIERQSGPGPGAGDQNAAGPQSRQLTSKKDRDEN